MKTGLEKLVKRMVKVFEENKVSYVIVGGIAVSSWGNVRTTRDVDVIVSLEKTSAEKLVSAFKKKGFVVTAKEIKQALSEESHFTVFDKHSNYHIDAKGVYGKREASTLKNRKKIFLGDLVLYVASPEDVIANKLLSGSEQDVRDAEGIYARQKNKLNKKRLRVLCKNLGVLAKFFKMRQKVGKQLRRLE